jgi:hypothetical protein
MRFDINDLVPHSLAGFIACVIMLALLILGAHFGILK